MMDGISVVRTSVDQDTFSAAEAVPAYTFGTLADGTHVRTFTTVLDTLATISRNTCAHTDTGATFPMTTVPTPAQQ